MREVLVAIGALALFAAIEATYYGVQYLADRRASELRRRLQAIGRAAALDADLLRRGRLARRAWAEALVAPLPGARALERLLEQSDSRLTVAQILAASAGAALGGVLVTVAFRLPALLGVVLAAAGGALPTLLVLGAREKRSQKISEQLPDALDMMARSLKAGHALTASFQVVASEMPQPVSVEFARAYEEQRLGLSLEEAVLSMAGRSPGNSDLKIFAVSAVIQRETGGNLAEILEKISDTIRQRYRFFGKLRALTAEGRASALVLGLLPIVVTTLIAVLNPKYIGTLQTSSKGPWIIGYAVTTWLVGLVWLRRMTKVDV